MAILEDNQRRGVGAHMADTGITNVDQCFKELDEILNSDWRTVCKEFNRIILGEAVPECMEECPVDTGTMRATIPDSSGVKATDTACVGIVGCGGPSAAYCRRQHEDLTFKHPVGKAKFIEDPVNRIAPKIPEKIAARMRHKGGSR